MFTQKSVSSRFHTLQIILVENWMLIPEKFRVLLVKNKKRVPKMGHQRKTWEEVMS